MQDKKCIDAVCIFFYFIRQKGRKDLSESDNQDNYKKERLYKSKPGKHERPLFDDGPTANQIEY